MKDFPNPRATIDGTGEGVLIGHPAQPLVILRRDAQRRLTITLRASGKTIGGGVLDELPDYTLRGTCTELDAVWQVAGKWHSLEFRER